MSIITEVYGFTFEEYEAGRKGMSRDFTFGALRGDVVYQNIGKTADNINGEYGMHPIALVRELPNNQSDPIVLGAISGETPRSIFELMKDSEALAWAVGLILEREQ